MFAVSTPQGVHGHHRDTRLHHTQPACPARHRAHGGITAAAAALGISSTAIDKHLAKLRIAFADDLIVFTGRETVVTPLGTKVLGLVDTLLETYAEIASLTPSRSVPEPVVASAHGAAASRPAP
nr:hypothetical protein GCM10025730_40760 [Promicromonospora thailandica]